MINDQQAKDIVQSTVRDFGIETISLTEGIGRVLREDWHCDRDLPPYDRVTMDGIAINYEGSKGAGALKIEGVVAAGDSQSRLGDVRNCVEIMTGAMLPLSCDTIIRYEDLDIADGSATISTNYQQHQNVHKRGRDRLKGDLLVTSGTRLTAAAIGVGASIGRAKIQVSKLPKCIVVSTGNELVEVHETPKPHQIRRGNVYRIQSTLAHLGLSVDTAHIDDDEALTITSLEKFIVQYDLIILSGGVSKGKFDYLPEALDRCGVKKLFHRIAQRPGKPLWFGNHDNGATVFALPGNPVSSFMCLNIYLLDWLNACLGLPLIDKPVAQLTTDVHFKPDLTYFLVVKVDFDAGGQLTATPMPGNGSGDLANLVDGDAFIRLPKGRDFFKKGEAYALYQYL